MLKTKLNYKQKLKESKLKELKIIKTELTDNNLFVTIRLDLKINDYNLKLKGENIKLAKINGKKKDLINIYRGQKIKKEKELMDLVSSKPKTIKLKTSKTHFVTLIFPNDLNKDEYLRINFLDYRKNLFESLDFKL